MTSPFSADSGQFQTILPLVVSDESRGLRVSLADGPVGNIRDDRGFAFDKTIQFEFQDNRIWIPCFIYTEFFEFIFKGEQLTTSHISTYCAPKDIAESTFIDQFESIFGRKPEVHELERLWADADAAIGIFLQNNRANYEAFVANPVAPRFVLFNAGHSGKVDWTTLNWRELADRALVAIHAARGA